MIKNIPQSSTVRATACTYWYVRIFLHLEGFVFGEIDI